MKYPRRSIHFVPGGNARMFEKSLGLAADSLILDLEDAVTPDRKEEARQQVCNWLRETDFGRQERLVRINPLESDWGRDDVAAIMECAPDGIVFPKVQSLADVEEMDRLLKPLEAKAGLSEPVPLLLIGTEVAAAVSIFRQCLSMSGSMVSPGALKTYQPHWEPGQNGMLRAIIWRYSASFGPCACWPQWQPMFNPLMRFL